MYEENTNVYENEAVEANYVPEESGKKTSLGGLIAIGALVVGGGIAVAKLAGKAIEKHTIKKLEKKGYTVSKPAVNADEVEVVDAGSDE